MPTSVCEAGRAAVRVPGSFLAAAGMAGGEAALDCLAAGAEGKLKVESSRGFTLAASQDAVAWLAVGAAGEELHHLISRQLRASAAMHA